MHPNGCVWVPGRAEAGRHLAASRSHPGPAIVPLPARRSEQLPTRIQPTMPAGLMVAELDADGWTCDRTTDGDGTQTLSCILDGLLGPDASAGFDLTVDSAPDVGGEIVNAPDEGPRTHPSPRSDAQRDRLPRSGFGLVWLLAIALTLAALGTPLARRRG